MKTQERPKTSERSLPFPISRLHGYFAKATGGLSIFPLAILFAVAGAVVADVGGILSHSAIVAREYGLPAVVGTNIGTTVIKDGQLITVDGNKGLVYLDGRTV